MRHPAITGVVYGYMSDNGISLRLQALKSTIFDDLLSGIHVESYRLDGKDYLILDFNDGRLYLIGHSLPLMKDGKYIFPKSKTARKLGDMGQWVERFAELNVVDGYFLGEIRARIKREALVGKVVIAVPVLIILLYIVNLVIF